MFKISLWGLHTKLWLSQASTASLLLFYYGSETIAKYSGCELHSVFDIVLYVELWTIFQESQVQSSLENKFQGYCPLC